MYWYQNPVSLWIKVLMRIEKKTLKRSWTTATPPA